MSDSSSRIDWSHRILAIIGGLLQAFAGFWVSVSGLVVPPWGVGVLVVAWLLTSYWAVRYWRRHRLASLAAFGVMAGFWVLFVAMGDVLFGFTA